MPPPSQDFALESIVFEPFLGLCTVQGSTQESMLGVEQWFYQLQQRQGNAVIKVPAVQMTSRGIRALLSPGELESALAEPGAPPAPKAEPYGQRFRRWTQLVRSEEKRAAFAFMLEWQELANQGERFSAKETEMHGKVQRALIQEVAQVLHLSSARAADRLEQWLAERIPHEGKKKNG